MRKRHLFLLLWFATPALAQTSYTFTTVPGPPTQEFIDLASVMTADSLGNLYVYDSRRAVVERVTPTSRMSIVAGKPNVQGHADGTVSAATIGSDSGIVGLAAAADGTIYFTESDHTVRRATPTGTVTTIAGLERTPGSVDGTGNAARFTNPDGVAVGADGAVYVADTGNHTIRRIDPGTGAVTTVAGSPGLSGYTDGQGNAARFNSPRGLFVSGFALLVADSSNGAIRRVALNGGTFVVSTVTVNGTIGGPTNVTANASDIYVTSGVNTLYRISASGSVSTVLSFNSINESLGDLVVDAAGTVQVIHGTVSVPANNRPPRSEVLVISPSGTVGTQGYIPDPQLEGLFYSSATIFVAAQRAHTRLSPSGQTVGAQSYMIDRVRAATADPDGSNAYVAAGCGILRILPSGDPQMIAGTAARAGTIGCGAIDAPKLSRDLWNAAARFNEPEGIARNASGVIYVADTGNSTIRMITADSTVTTILGAAGVTGSADGLGTASRFHAPTGLAVDAAGNLFIADTGNHTIRKVTPLGDVTTFAGQAGVSGSGDGAGAAARFNGPRGLSFAPDGSLFVADTGNSLVRKVSPSGQVATVTGATFNQPRGIAVDSTGAVYVADTGNAQIRVGTLGAATAPVITTQPADFAAAAMRDRSISAAASGSPAPGYRWQSSTDGVTWTALSEFTPYRGVFTDTLTIVETPASLNGTKYRCVVANVAGSVTSAAATLTVVNVTVAPSRLSFAAVRRPGASANEIQSSAETVTVNWNGPAVPWTVTVDQPWLLVSPASGAGAGSFVVQVVSGGPASGAAATGTVTLSFPQVNLTLTLPVTFTFYTSDSGPTGVIDTPANNAVGLSGAFAVTGWAIDNVGVDHVEIWRDPVAGETPVPFAVAARRGKIIVGMATLVPGARPDVQAAFPDAPGVYRAGWGYMLLSYGLPNQGNGTFTLHAFAVDGPSALANATLIGSKTVTIDNVNATKPFGAIDTPASGATVSGVITNVGWALTPGASCSIANPNVKVSIDSGPLQTVTYGDARADIASAFPGYTNAAAAGGRFTLDTTTLTNGLHTIGWLVTDSCGRAEGIGSRFFSVSNTSSAATTASGIAAAVRRVGDDEWALVRNGATETPDVATDGTRVVRLEQTERIELRLPGAVTDPAGELPLGSSFDAATGTFAWQPAAGFLGAYDLEFNADSDVEKVRVVVGPPIRMAIDTPRAGNVLSASGFTLAGWAVDLASLDGAGIDTLHVWAYPMDGGAPVFVGAARGSGRRPDVARLYGETFSGAGFTLHGRLVPGTYDLVVYAHSAAAKTFAGAEVVRVVVR